jgi:arylsulfatase
MHNVLLVTIDSLRPDYLGCYSDWARAEGLSPHLDEWARGACLFETAISQGPRTPEAFPAILSGQYASRYRDVFGGLSPDRRLISEILKEHGYACAAFNSNPYISQHSGYGRGFDRYQDNLPLRRLRGVAGRIYLNLFRLRNLLCEPYTPAPRLNRQVFSWLAGAKAPFFLWVHYMDVHGPYIPKKGWRPYQRFRAGCLWRKATHAPGTVTSQENERLRAAYKEEIRHTDRYLKDLLDKVDPGRTLVVITADHGEMFGEHGFYGHTNNLYDSLLKVPLLLKLPGQREGKRLGRMVRSLDIVPTILEAAGLGRAAETDGQSLMPLADGRPELYSSQHAISEIWTKHLCVRTEEWKLIANYVEGEKELFNLPRDPGEIHNLASERPEVVQEFEQIIHEHLLAINAPPDDLRQCGVEVDAAMQSRLRALGYM